MKVLVLNGSPKGDYSITLQTAKYLEACFPEDTFQVLHVGQRIKAIEKDFSQAEAMLKEADLWLFAYPVYTFIASYQLHRFIELMKEHGVDASGKYATQISTSKHFYDVTAHRYIQENCADLGLKYVRGLSADMDDLLTPKGRQEAEAFWKRVKWCVKSGFAEQAMVHPSWVAPACYLPDLKETEGDKPGDVVIVTDLLPEDTVLEKMIACFRAECPRKTRVINLREYPFQGGCLGCFHCATDGQCIYKDNFDRFLREKIQTAQATVYAFTIKDHSMGARFKLYDDRQFCNGHRTVTMGKPVAYLINGRYSEEANLQMILEGRSQVGGNHLAGIATSEGDVLGQIKQTAASLDYALTQDYQQPANFYGVGGMKIFRDLIYLMQGMMKADHRFYKAHGQYDFPQKKKGTLLKMYLVGALLSSPKLKSKLGNKMNEGMIGPYRKVLEAAQGKQTEDA